MDAATLKALKASIAKWDRNAKAETPSEAKVFGDTCPLCDLFVNTAGGLDEYCDGCPVMESTGAPDCIDSPWERAVGARRDWLAGKCTAAVFHSAAKAEADFLRTLLPEGESV